MKSQINLFSKKYSKASDPRILYIAVGIFFITFVLTLGVLLYYQYLKSSYADLEAQELSLRQTINTSYAQKKADLLVLKDRMQYIQKILSVRVDLSTKVTTILRSLPQSLAVNGIDAKTEEITVQLSSDSLFEINKLLEESIKDFPQTQAGGLKKIDLTSFGLEKKTSRYIFSLRFTF